MDDSTEESRGSWTLSVEPRVAVVGIGGAGCNIINDIYWTGDSGIETMAINMDRKALSELGAHRTINICRRVTRGEGAKGDPDLGRSCGKAHMDEIEEALQGYDVVFIVAGMGGGTGTGVAPVVAEICRRLNQITFAVLINPFSFETARSRVAREGLRRMRQTGCINVVVDNDMLLKAMPDATMDAAFREANQSILGFINGTTQKVKQRFIAQLDDMDEIVQESGDEEVSGLCAFEPVRIN
ncbi:MAG: cell division protein FtsZ [Candidatus Methanomethylophilaceae archaeon]|nr:cell division protein FtsZ [Candidatus Methanomethylophilaceae archaeon]